MIFHRLLQSLQMDSEVIDSAIALFISFQGSQKAHMSVMHACICAEFLWCRLSGTEFPRSPLWNRPLTWHYYKWRDLVPSYAFLQFDSADPTNLCVAIESSLITPTPNHCPPCSPSDPSSDHHNSPQQPGGLSTTLLRPSTLLPGQNPPSRRSLPSRMVQFLQNTSWPTVPRPTLFPELLVRPPFHALCGG